MSAELTKARIRDELLGSSRETLESLGLRRDGSVYLLETANSVLRLWIDFHRRVRRPVFQVRAVIELINKPESRRVGLQFSAADGGFVEKIVFMGPRGVRLDSGWWTILNRTQLRAACKRLRTQLLGTASGYIAELRKLRPTANRNPQRRAMLAQLKGPGAVKRITSKKLKVPIDASALVEVKHFGVRLNPRLVRKWRASIKQDTHGSRKRH